MKSKSVKETDGEAAKREYTESVNAAGKEGAAKMQSEVMQPKWLANEARAKEITASQGLH